MEAFASLKFWKSNTSKVAAGTTTGDGGVAEAVLDSAVAEPLTEDSDDDDSFFELELTLPHYDSNFPKSDSCSKHLDHERDYEFKRNSKPQSPISILRPGSPKLPVFLFGKLGKTKRDEFETDSVSSSMSLKRNDWSLFTVKFRIEDGSIVPKFTRSNSSSVYSTKSSNECHESSKRLSRDVILKYLNRIKPLYTKSSKRLGEMEKFTASPARSTTSFPSPTKEREEKQRSKAKVKGKQLRKSKSVFAAIGTPSPVIFPMGSDHPHDGIEGAILHCKRSLSSSKGHSSLSRCTSDPSHEKSIQASEKSES